MKTPKFYLLAMIFSPAALLLSNCASTGNNQPQAFGSRASPATYREHVASRSAMDDPLATLFNWVQFEISEKESAWLMPLESTSNKPDEPDAVQIAPLVVTGTALPDVAPEGWPGDVIDAELMADWITPPESGASRRHVTDDSVSEWMRSLR
jgi:hypothetical protein